MRVSVVIPVWNEGSHLASNLRTLADALRHGCAQAFEIIVVDDGSTDATLHEARSFAASEADVRVVTHATNRGVAAAISTGAKAALGDVVVVLDADLSYDPSHVWRMVEEQRRTGAPIVVASPYMRGGSVIGVPFERRVLSRLANGALALADHRRSRTYTGMVRAYDRATLLQLLADGTLTNERILLRARRLHIPIVEIAAALRWPNERGRGRMTPHRIARRIASVFACGAEFAMTR